MCGGCESFDGWFLPDTVSGGLVGGVVLEGVELTGFGLRA